MTKRSDFEWEPFNDLINQEKHGVSFALAQLAFLDQHRIILEDLRTAKVRGDINASVKSLMEF
jgi:uncharacterized DUF497 family protein